MTKKAFDRANELVVEIAELRSLTTTLKNSAASENISLCSCRMRDILTVAHLNEDVCEKFVAIVEEEIAKKEAEFDSL